MESIKSAWKSTSRKILDAVSRLKHGEEILRHPHRFMIKALPVLLLFLVLWIPSAAISGDAAFRGTWTIDIRPKSDRNADCGHAYFTLLRKGNRICGDHVFYTPGCGRLNEGFPGSVRGVVVGSTAVLVVTSGRNGAIVMGQLTRKGNTVHWVTLEEIKGGDPEGDSPLMLGEGVLKKNKSALITKELIDACKVK